MRFDVSFELKATQLEKFLEYLPASYRSRAHIVPVDQEDDAPPDPKASKQLANGGVKLGKKQRMRPGTRLARGDRVEPGFKKGSFKDVILKTYDDLEKREGMGNVTRAMLDERAKRRGVSKNCTGYISWLVREDYLRVIEL